MPKVKTLYTKEKLTHWLMTNPGFLERALLKLYARQTQDEQISQTATHHNRMGFSGVDAEILTSFAQQVIRKEQRGIPEGARLSPKQREVARKKLCRYTRQLAEIAEAHKPSIPEMV